VNNTLQNGFKLLELLAAIGREVSVTELSAQASLPPSHVCRLLKTLLQTGYVEQSAETRRYRVSLKLLNLAHARLVNLDFRRIGHPYAMQLAESLQANAFLSQPLQGRSIIVAVAYPSSSLADSGIVVGQIHSVCHSACGKVCATAPMLPAPSVSTKVVAAPMPTAVSSFLDTPMKGQRPRMRTKTTLLTRTAPMTMKI